MDGQLTRVIANGIVAAPYGMFRAHVVIAGERVALLRGQTAYAGGETQVGAGVGRFLSGRDDYSLAGRPAVTPSEPGTGP